MSAITREQGDIFYHRIMEIRGEVAVSVKEKARQVEQVTRPFREASALINEAYKEFGDKVHNEYDGTPSEDLAELFLLSSIYYFCSSRDLQGEVCQILQEKRPKTTL